jgi:hypothetical protein
MARRDRRLPFRHRGERAALSPWRRWWQVWMMRRWGRTPDPRMIVDFYDQFLALVSSSGLFPQPHETHREFSRLVEQSLRNVLARDGLATLPRDVTEVYCRVRFGAAEPPLAEIVRLDERLRRLADALRQRTAQGR